MENIRHKYPFCIPASLDLPKKNYTKLFDSKRKEFRTNELLRREKMLSMINTIEKRTKISYYVKDVAIEKNYTTIWGVSFQLKLCKYCSFIFSAVTVNHRLMHHTREAEDDPVFLLRSQIINTCISFMEEYSALNLFMKALISKEKLTEIDFRNCEMSLKIVKAKETKVMQLEQFINAFSKPKRDSDSIISFNIIRALNEFKRTTVFASINELNDYEVLMDKLDNDLNVTPDIVCVSNAMIPITGGEISIELNISRHLRITINKKDVPFTSDGYTITIQIPPMQNNQKVVDFVLYYKDKPVELPGDFVYFSSNKPSNPVEKTPINEESTTQAAAPKRHILFVEEDTEEDSSSYDSSDEYTDDSDEDYIYENEPKLEDYQNNEKIELESQINDTEPNINTSKEQQVNLSTSSNGESGGKVPRYLQPRLTYTQKELRRCRTMNAVQKEPITTTKENEQTNTDTSNINQNTNSTEETKPEKQRKKWRKTTNLINPSRREERKKQRKERKEKKKVDKEKKKNHSKQSSQTESIIEEQPLSGTGVIKTSTQLTNIVDGVNSTIQVLKFDPCCYYVGESGLFTISGLGFGLYPVVYIGDKMVEAYETISDNVIVGYLPYYKVSNNLNLVIENEYGNREVYENAISVLEFEC
ncbi:IPT/TIG domain-containing protein [Entamoeba marina]